MSSMRNVLKRGDPGFRMDVNQTTVQQDLGDDRSYSR